MSLAVMLNKVFGRVLR